MYNLNNSKCIPNRKFDGLELYYNQIGDSGYSNKTHSRNISLNNKATPIENSKVNLSRLSGLSRDAASHNFTEINQILQKEKLILSENELSSITLPPSVKLLCTENDPTLNQTIVEPQYKMVKKERLRRIIEHDIEFKKLIVQKANLMRIKYQNCRSDLKEAKAVWDSNVSRRVLEKLKEFSGISYQSELNVDTNKTQNSNLKDKLE